MPFIETRDESEYPWLATASWLDDGSPALLYEYSVTRRAAEAYPSEFADAIKGAAPARESEPRVAASTVEERSFSEARSPTGLERLISGLVARLRGGPAAAPAGAGDNKVSWLGDRA